MKARLKELRESFAQRTQLIRERDLKPKPDDEADSEEEEHETTQDGKK